MWRESPCSEFGHFLLSCKHSLIFCTLKVADVSWIAHRLELVPFQSQGECSPDYNAHIDGWDLFFPPFFNANDFHLWNKITTNYGFQSFKSEESRLKKEVTFTTSTHTALHLCGLKIKLSTPHLRTIIFCRTSHFRLHSSTVYCKDVNTPASEAFTDSLCIFIKAINPSPSWIYCIVACFDLHETLKENSGLSI